VAKARFAAHFDPELATAGKQNEDEQDFED
jgi:hypothetical protein